MARTLTTPGPDRTNRLIFIGAMALALLAAVAIFAALRNFGEDSGGGPLGGTMEVLVASRDLSAGTELSDDMLEFATVPEKSSVTGFFTKKDDLLKKRIAYPMVQGQQFAQTQIISKDGKADDISVLLTGANKRAFSIETDQTRVFGGLLVPGNYVDIIAVVESGDSNISRGVVLVQDARVISVADEALEPGAEAPKDADAQPRARNVVLEVNPGDDALLAIAAEDGSLYLSIRPAGDHEIRANPPQVVLPGAE